YKDVFFFFASRRRHTRSDRDWSSDVCSSDLLRRRRYKLPAALGPVVRELDHLPVAPALEGPQARLGAAGWRRSAGCASLVVAPRSEERRVGKEGRARGRAGEDEGKGTER